MSEMNYILEDEQTSVYMEEIGTNTEDKKPLMKQSQKQRLEDLKNRAKKHRS